VPAQDRGDIRHSIILELALARRRDGDKSLTFSYDPADIPEGVAEGDPLITWLSLPVVGKWL